MNKNKVAMPLLTDDNAVPRTCLINRAWFVTILWQINYWWRVKEVMEK